MPATDFDSAIALMNAGEAIRIAPLVKFNFKSGVSRVWPGFGPIEINGETYTGLGDLGRISAVNSGPGQPVEELNLALSAGPEIIGRFSDDSAESEGRDVNVYLQFFNDNWAAVGATWEFYWGTMGPLKVERPPAGDDSVATRTISVIATDAFINRARPRQSYFSDRDQRARYPGDNIFINIEGLLDKRIRWPYFA